MELAESYLYCPVCGAKRTQFTPVRPFHCEKCEHVSFFGPVSAVGAVVTNSRGQVLLIQRARDPQRGKLGMPGGFVDQGESAEAALRREVYEEVGLCLDELKFLMTAPNSYEYRGVTIPVLDMFYHAPVHGESQIAPQPSEVSDWMWTDLTDAILREIAFESNRTALEYYRNALVPSMQREG